MSLPHYEPFYLQTLDDLRGEIDRLGVEIPLSEDLGGLGEAPVPGGAILNRFCAQPVTGRDAEADGSPGVLTRRRYRRLAAGGFAVIWVEGTVLGKTAPPGRLRLGEDNVERFAEWVAQLREAAAGELTVVLQVDGDKPLGMDLVRMAGVDAVDVQGGGVMGTEVGAGLMTASRLVAYNATGGAGGVGTDTADYRREDLTEVVEMVRGAHRDGLGMLNVTCASPRLRGPSGERQRQPIPDHGVPDEHPLQVLARQLRVAGALRAAVPGLPVVGSGFSWLRHLLPYVAAGAVERGMVDLVGLGRSALACPDLPTRILSGEGVDLGRTCMVCFACSGMLERGGPVGCPVRDAETYGVEPAPPRRVASEDLPAEAARCHRCEAAPCVAASRTGLDIPAMIEAYRRGDDAGAYEVIRRVDVLPELSARLTPGWLHSEGVCVERALTGEPVPILDLQLEIARQARKEGRTGVRLPEEGRGASVAVVGGGPAGLAAVARLLERGHAVTLYERADRVGGTPELVIPGARLESVQVEIEAVLTPAVEAGRLVVRDGEMLGETVVLDALCRDFDAVLLAMGVWQERRLIEVRVDGVVDGLAFLGQAKCGECTGVPQRVAILAGGDCAMDVVREAERLGARDLFVIYPGPQAEMHWHMSGDWFVEPGHHALMGCEVLELVVDGGRVSGLRVRQCGEERLLEVGLVVEAMGLQVDDALWDALPGVAANGHGLVALVDGALTTQPGVYAAGGLVNGGASVARCIAEGLAAAEDVHRDLEK